MTQTDDSCVSGDSMKSSLLLDHLEPSSAVMVLKRMASVKSDFHWSKVTWMNVLTKRTGAFSRIELYAPGWTSCKS